MDSARYQQIFEAFRSLLEVPSADRVTRLEALAAGDEDLRRHVAELLAAAEKSALDAFSEERLASQDWRPDREVPQTEHPERIGPYRILRLIGEGGMGRVFEAEQDEPRRRVALKLLASGAGSEPLRRRFRLEADVLARLQHPGIAPIFEYGELDGPHGLQPWFAMELVDGVDLRTWAEREALSVERRLDLVARVADAVEHAHAKGVIHRDLKPDNVLVDREGRPRVLDFGIARVLDDSTLLRTAVTGTGQLIGTLNYMAPEQLTGDGGGVAPPTDVYALGVMLFELLAGRRPHELAGLALAAAVRHAAEDPAPSLHRLASVPRDVATIVSKALEKDPARRYATPGSLAADLRRFLDHRPITARAPSALYLARRFARRNRGLVVGLGAALVVLVVGVAAVLEFARREAQARGRADQVALDAVGATYRALEETFARGATWEALRTLESIPLPLRGWEWSWFRRRLPLVLEGVDGDAVWDGHRLATRTLGPLFGSIVAVDLRWPERRELLQEPRGRELMILQASERVVVQRILEGFDPEISFVDLDEPGAALETFALPFRYPPDHDLDPDDRRNLAAMVDAVGGDTVVVRCSTRPDAGTWLSTGADRAAGRPPRRLPAAFEDEGALALSPDGTWLAHIAQEDGTLTLHEVVSPSEPLAIHAEPARRIRFSPSGDRLAVLGDATLEVLEVPSLAPLRSFPWDTTGDITGGDLFWSGPEAVLAARYESRTIERIDLETGERTPFDAPDQRPFPLRSASPDGRYFTGDASRGAWIRELGAPTPKPFVERAHSDWARAVVYSPRGDWFATMAPNDPEVRVWDGWTGEPLAVLERATSVQPGVGLFAPLSFDPEGRFLVTAEPVEGAQARTVRLDLLTGEAVRGEPFPEEEVLLLPPHYIARFVEALGALPERLGPMVHRHPSGRRAWITGSPYDPAAAPLRLLDLETGATTEVPFGDATGLAVSPDGRRLAVGRLGSIDVLDAHSGTHLARLLDDRGEQEDYRDLSWSPDGTRLAVGTQRGEVLLVETEHFRVMHTLSTHERFARELAWSPDGERLVSVGGDGKARLYDTHHPLPAALLAKDREARAEVWLERLERLVEQHVELSRAVAALLAEAGTDRDALVAARRACLLRWVRESDHR